MISPESTVKRKKCLKKYQRCVLVGKFSGKLIIFNCWKNKFEGQKKLLLSNSKDCIWGYIKNLIWSAIRILKLIPWISVWISASLVFFAKTETNEELLFLQSYLFECF